MASEARAGTCDLHAHVEAAVEAAEEAEAEREETAGAQFRVERAPRPAVHSVPLPAGMASSGEEGGAAAAQAEVGGAMDAVTGSGPGAATPERVEEVLQAVGDDGYERALRTGLQVDEACAARYVRASRGNVRLAIQNLLGTIAWREEFDTRRFPPEELLRMGSTGKLFVHGKDQMGRAVIIMTPAAENARDEHSANVRHLVYTLERAVASMAGTPREQFTLLIDFRGFKLGTAPKLKTSKAVLSILQAHYPERLGVAYMVAAPKVFSVFWQAIRGLVDPVTRAKLVFVPTRRDGSFSGELFAAAFGPDALPARFGGLASVDFDAAAYYSEVVWREGRQEAEWV